MMQSGAHGWVYAGECRDLKGHCAAQHVPCAPAPKGTQNDTCTVSSCSLCVQTLRVLIPYALEVTRAPTKSGVWSGPHTSISLPLTQCVKRRSGRGL